MVPSKNLYRIEKDSMGPVKVPKEAYFGAQTQRAVENFPDERLAIWKGIYLFPRSH